jgi:hypothetical protein
MGRLAVQDQFIGAVSRMRQEQIRISLRTSSDQKILDIRVYVENDLGQWIPTPRGVSLRPAEYKRLKEVLDGLKEKKGGANGAG